jgi:hypothetical protein
MDRDEHAPRYDRACDPPSLERQGPNDEAAEYQDDDDEDNHPRHRQSSRVVDEANDLLRNYIQLVVVPARINTYRFEQTGVMYKFCAAASLQYLGHSLS